MSRSFRAAKNRYLAAKSAARSQATANLAPLLGIRFTLTGWSLQTNAELALQWPASARQRGNAGGWDWDALFRHYYRNAPDVLDIVIWAPPNRLCGMALAKATGEAVVIEFIEGDPREDCPLAGSRALIVLETAHCYAQRLGKRELRLHPANDRLAELYRDAYGFVLETPRGRASYYRREVS